MTIAEFTAFYPQFAGFTPAAALLEYVRQANARFSSFPEADAEEARRLYAAHKLTLYAGTALPKNAEADPAALAAAGQARQRIASRKVGEVSVAYASGTSSSVSTGLADLPETDYGLQLLSLIRQHSRSVYIP